MAISARAGRQACVIGAVVLSYALLAARAEAAAEPALPAIELQLRGVEDTIKGSDAQRRRIEGEIAGLHADRARLNADLIESTARIGAREADLTRAEQRLDTLTGSEEAIRRSLESRRAVVGQVLAALQRMGRKPPPAVLASPQDMLAAIRTSMMLGAVVPELRAETDALAADLAELVSVREAIAAERGAVNGDLADLGAQRLRLGALISARQAALGDAEHALAAARERAADLSKQATSLKDLINRMEAEVSAAARAAADARRADAARKMAEQAEAAGAKARFGGVPLRDPARLSPAIAFSAARGQLPLPVSGALVKSFGAPDGFGGVEKGLSIAARASAVVAAPADGWVAFSGPYRTYGQLLIINVGDGYYVVLAGMDRLNVEVGQFVLAGEPVASMGAGSAKAAAAIAIGAAQPILYVEFRKDGAAVDPSPWWAKPEIEKVRG